MLRIYLLMYFTGMRAALSTVILIALHAVLANGEVGTNAKVEPGLILDITLGEGPDTPTIHCGMGLGLVPTCFAVDASGGIHIPSVDVGLTLHVFHYSAEGEYTGKTTVESEIGTDFVFDFTLDDAGSSLLLVAVPATGDSLLLNVNRSGVVQALAGPSGPVAKFPTAEEAWRDAPSENRRFFSGGGTELIGVKNQRVMLRSREGGENYKYFSFDPDSGEAGPLSSDEVKQFEGTRATVKEAYPIAKSAAEHDSSIAKVQDYETDAHGNIYFMTIQGDSLDENRNRNNVTRSGRLRIYRIDQRSE